jgi:small subunit ribosomal protein S17
MADETTNEATETSEDAAAGDTPAADEPSVGAVEPAADEATAEAAEPDAAEPESAVPETEPEDAGPEQAPAAEEPARKRKRLPRALRPQRARPKRERPATRKPIVRLPKPESERGRRQERRGVVVSSAMDKTIVVKVDTIKAHPRYKKVVRRSAKFHAHDERNEANVGDVVRIVETRPLSKSKHWRLAEVLEAAK